LNLCFQGAHKQKQTSSQRQPRASRQANNLSFFICNGFEIWFFGRRSNSWNFWTKRNKTFSKQHFLGFSFTYILFFHRVCVVVSMNVCVWSGMCLFLCIKGKLGDLVRETNHQLQFNGISMLGVKLVTTPPPKEPSPTPVL
jgi:hypothetical protein